jgi:hypothetical protein
MTKTKNPMIEQIMEKNNFNLESVDVYDCESGHSFAVIHDKKGKKVQITLCCPFCSKKFAHYNGSFALAHMRKLKDEEHIFTNEELVNINEELKHDLFELKKHIRNKMLNKIEEKLSNYKCGEHKRLKLLIQKLKQEAGSHD